MDRINLEKVAIIGRSLSDYIAMFMLKPDELKGKKIIDFGSGVCSFVKEANDLGINVIGIDPIYSQNSATISERSENDIYNIGKQIEFQKDRFEWSDVTYTGMPQYYSKRLSNLKMFLADFKKNKEHYLNQSLPKLDFNDKEFELGLVSHLLFLYDNICDYRFHIASIREMMRICKEVQIHPITDLTGKPSKMIRNLKKDLPQFDISIELVDYEWHRGSSFTLIIKEQNIKS